jgi:hypothetical protein
MKSEIRTFFAALDTPIIYPCLMKHVTEDFIVLFTSDISGTVIRDERDRPNKKPIGYHSDTWYLSARDSSIWKPLPSNQGVIISND